MVMILLAPCGVTRYLNQFLQFAPQLEPCSGKEEDPVRTSNLYVLW